MTREIALPAAKDQGNKRVLARTEHEGTLGGAGRFYGMMECVGTQLYTSIKFIRLNKNSSHCLFICGDFFYIIHSSSKLIKKKNNCWTRMCDNG